MTAYLTLGILYAIYSFSAKVAQDTADLMEDMELALEMERLIRTRSDLVETALIGPVFHMFCDASDFVHFNFCLLYTSPSPRDS